MTSRVQHVFRVEPYRILLDLGVPITQEDGRFFVPLPEKRVGRMLLDEGSLVSDQPQCSIVACSLFDYAKYVLGDYASVVDFLIEHYHTNAQATPGTSLASLRPAFIEDLKATREQFESVLQLRQRMLDSEDLLPSFLWCRHRGISVRCGWRSFYLVRRKDLTPFVERETEQEIALEDEHYIVFPYLLNPHTFGWLRIFSSNTPANFTLSFQKSPYGFYGLHTCLPNVREIRIYDDPVTTQLAYSTEAEMAHDQIGCIHVGITGTQEANDYRLSRAVFVQTKQSSFSQIAQTRVAVRDLSVTNGEAGDPSIDVLSAKSVSWSGHVLSEITRCVQDHTPDSPKLLSLIDVIRTDRDLCEMVLRHLEQQGLPEIVAKVRQHLNSNQTYLIGGMEVVETPNGYVARRKGVSSPFTNFIVRLDHNVFFEDSDNESMHCGRLIMQGQEFPLVLPNICLRKPGNIPSVCLSAVVKAGVSDQPGFFPQIVDSTLVRRLGEVLSVQAGTKTSRLGIKRLGWNDARTKFVTPVWEATAKGVAPTSRIPYPGSRFLQSHYDFHNYRYVQAHDLVTSHTHTFMCMVASGIVRSFLHLMVPPVEIMRNPASIDLLHALFHPFGQSSPIPFGSQRRAAQNILARENLLGYPVFGVAADSEIVSGTSYPIFLISDTGVPFHEEMNTDAYAQTAGYAQRIFSGLLLHCLRNPQQMHLLIESEDEPSVPDMIGEGKTIIERCLGIEHFNIFASRMPTFEMLLGNVPFEQAGDFFRYDMPNGRIFIRMRKFPSFSRREVVEELGAQNAEVRLHGNHYISCPADFLFSLLNEFFGRPVKLFHQDLEPDQAEPAATAQDAAKQSAS